MAKPTKLPSNESFRTISMSGVKIRCNISCLMNFLSQDRQDQDLYLAG